MLGESHPREPSAEQAASLEAFGLAATDLMRINLELELDTQRAFWNADDVLGGSLDDDLPELGAMTPEAARELTHALTRLLEAAEEAAPYHRTRLRMSLPPSLDDSLLLEWYDDGPEMAVTNLHPGAGAEALAAEASPAYREHAETIGAALARLEAVLACGMIRGRLLVQTFA